MPSSNLSFYTSGPHYGQPIVFLHGGGVAGWMWKPVMEGLREFFCLAPDLPGHGASQHITPFSIGLAAQKVADLMQDQVPGDRATVVGLSEGAQVAVQLLAAAPAQVEKAIISSALLRPLPGGRWIGSPGMLAWLYRLTIRPFRSQEWWIKLNMNYAAGIPEKYFGDFKKSFQEMSESGFVHLMAANQSFRLPDGVGDARAPVLALAGKKEYAAMKESVRDLVRALPNARGGLVNLGRGSRLPEEHNWALSAPDIFAATVRAWMNELPLPSEIELI